MNAMAKKLFVLLAMCTLGSSATGCVSSQVTAVTASPDGKSVIAVGAQMKNHGFGWFYARPLQWYCARGADEQLVCERVEPNLPKPAKETQQVNGRTVAVRH